MVDCTLEVEDDVARDVACLIDDMEKSDFSRSFVLRGWTEGRDDRALECERMGGARCRWRHGSHEDVEMSARWRPLAAWQQRTNPRQLGVQDPIFYRRFSRSCYSF